MKDDEDKNKLSLSSGKSKDLLAKNSTNTVTNSKLQGGRKSYSTKLSVEEISKQLKKVDPGFFRLAGSASSIGGKIEGEILTLEMISAVSMNHRNKVRRISFELITDEEGTKLIPCETPRKYLSETINVMVVLLFGFGIYKIYGQNVINLSSSEICLMIVAVFAFYFIVPRVSKIFGGVLQGILEKEQAQMDEFIIKNLQAETIEPNKDSEVD